MITINVKKRDEEAMDADDDGEIPFGESDFGAESRGASEGSEGSEGCQNSECFRVKEEYEKLMVETIRWVIHKSKKVSKIFLKMVFLSFPTLGK